MRRRGRYCGRLLGLEGKSSRGVELRGQTGTVLISQSLRLLCPNLLHRARAPCEFFFKIIKNKKFKKIINSAKNDFESKFIVIIRVLKFLQKI